VAEVQEESTVRKRVMPPRTNVEMVRQTSLPAGTEIRLEMLQTVTTEGGKWKRDDEFSLAVAEDVLLGEYMIIPRGTRAVGRVRWTTGRGMFGKSGKIEVEVDRLILGGRDIRLLGRYRQIGESGLTNAATIIAAGPFAGLITGESGLIAKGTVLSAYLADALPVVSPYKEGNISANDHATFAVRARQISVADAFGDLWKQDAKIDRSRSRVKVADAFTDYLNVSNKAP
jgi:hypothetical protein